MSDSDAQLRLRSLSYSEFVGTPREWRLEQIDLADFNLVTGLNASGKSRTLAVICNLAKLIDGRQQRLFGTGSWRATFADQRGTTWVYGLELRDGRVHAEALERAGQALLEVQADGHGHIHSVELHRSLKVKLPGERPAVSAREDSVQHPFLTPLLSWARGLHQFHFGAMMGKDRLVVPHDEAPELDARSSDQVVAVFMRGCKRFPDVFHANVVADVQRVGFPVTGVRSERPDWVTTSPPMDLFALIVDEAGVAGPVRQNDISQGMWRSLAVVILVNYLILDGSRSCVVVDDIGEGLDHARSYALIHVLMEKAQAHGVQVILATNDKYVMNAVPLDCWRVVHRKGSAVRILDSVNSKERFEEFEFTGLNNFDLLATGFLTDEAGL